MKFVKAKHAFFASVLFCLLAGHVFVLHLVFATPHIAIQETVSEKHIDFQVLGIAHQIISPLETELLIQDTTPIIRGQASPHALVVLNIQGNTKDITHTTSANAQGEWFMPFTSPLAPGSYLLRATSDGVFKQIRFAISESSQIQTNPISDQFLHMVILESPVFQADELPFSFETKQNSSNIQTIQISILSESFVSLFTETIDFTPKEDLTLQLPTSIPAGEYILYIRAKDESKQFSSSAPFSISESTSLISLSLFLSSSSIFPIALILVISNLLLISIFLIKEMRQLSKRRPRA